ncbi:MAG: tetratricopeptide repeat protein [Candidatus Omnitrophica bacterium]|nr:tetratricopeptide repeat protein [Candidatus Omnitrophota bacterium]
MNDLLRRRYSEALDLMAADKYEKAAASMELILQDSPDFLEVYEGLAMVYSHQNQTDRAIEVIQKLISIDPDNIMAHANLSVFYMKKGMIEAAEEEKAKATVLRFSKGNNN